MQRMDAHIHNIIVGVNQLDGFLGFAFHLNFLQTTKFPNPVIHVGYVIANGQGGQLFERDGLLFGKAILDRKLMVTFKNLVISITGKLVLRINKSLVYREHHSLVMLANVFVVGLV